MTREWLPDARVGVLVALAYLMVRLLLWPVWDRPLAWQDFVLAACVGGAAVAARWMRH